MAHYKKLYRKIKNNPKDVRFDDLEILLTRVGGFESTPGSGDHYGFSHPDLPNPITVDSRGKHKPLKPIYVKKALQAFEELNPDFIAD